MIVCHSVAIGRNDEAGALAGNKVAASASRHTLGSIRNIRHSKTAEKVAQSRRNVATAEATGLRAAIDLDSHGNHCRFDLLDNVGESDRRLHLAGLLGKILRDRGGIGAFETKVRRSDERCGTEASNGGGEKDEPATIKHARLLRNNARLHQQISIGFFWRASAQVRTLRWCDEPYGVLSAGLNFCKTRNRERFEI